MGEALRLKEVALSSLDLFHYNLPSAIPTSVGVSS